MDKTTKAFVIGACSVVIAVPVVWIGSQVSEAYLTHKAEKARLERNALRRRRTNECRTRASVLFPEETALDEWTYKERREWLEKCQGESAPVEQLGR